MAEAENFDIDVSVIEQNDRRRVLEMAGVGIAAGAGASALLVLASGEIAFADHPCAPGELDVVGVDYSVDEYGNTVTRMLCADGSPTPPTNPPNNGGGNGGGGGNSGGGNGGNSGGNTGGNTGGNGGGNGGGGNHNTVPAGPSAYEQLLIDAGCSPNAMADSVASNPAELEQFNLLILANQQAVDAAKAAGTDQSGRYEDVLTACAVRELTAEETPEWFDVAAHGRPAYNWDTILANPAGAFTPSPEQVQNVDGYLHALYLRQHPEAVPTTTAAPTTTEAPATTVAETTTAAPATTEAATTTTEAPATTEATTTTVVVTTTEAETETTARVIVQAGDSDSSAGGTGAIIADAPTTTFEAVVGKDSSTAETVGYIGSGLGAAAVATAVIYFVRRKHGHRHTTAVPAN